MNSAPPVPEVQDRSAVVEQPTCAVCPHPLAAHDAISLRFCQATQAHAVTRGCVCPSA
jgi:hypothetical protein